MRAMARDDVENVLAIEQTIQRFPWTRGNFCDALQSGYLCYVHEENGELCSYAVMMPVAGDAELLSIGVTLKRQREGLGRAMLNRVLEEACNRNMRSIFLEVRSGNAAAIALYRGAGFIETGVRRRYYRSALGSEDAMTMARELTGTSNG